MKHDIAIAFGSVIRQQRLMKGFSQQELSFQTDIGRSFLSELETGRKLPTLLTIYRLSKVLDVSLAELMAEVEKALALKT
ncbi:MAG: helix-turn-helix transcriptional regulator [Candidatus Kapaibacterium sp.]